VHYTHNISFGNRSGTTFFPSDAVPRNSRHILPDVSSTLTTALDSTFNLGSSDRFTSILSPDSRTNEDKDTYLKTVSALLKRGIVGYEYLDVHNKPYKSFITTQIGDLIHAGARLYRRKIYAAYI